MSGTVTAEPAERKSWLKAGDTQKKSDILPELRRERLLSLDAFRGITMFLLIGEGARVYHESLDIAPEGSFLAAFALQFHHHPWNGLRFWDLIQPFFMFIVGVAMAYSLEKRWSKGATWNDTFRHILKRCALLLMFGVALHCGYSRQLVWELWNVLSQLSFTILVAYLIYRLPLGTQLVISFVLIGVTEFLYRTVAIPGFDQPFVQGQNFGAWMDTVLMGKINPDGWVAINALPTAAHTIWGVLAAKLLMSERTELNKLRILAAAGLIGLVVGYGLDLAGITPIIKRICTSSFVIVSGGWCLVMLAFLYWLVDVRKVSRWTTFFIIVGMNPIFIYLFTETVGIQWLNGFARIFTGGFLSAVGLSEPLVHLLDAIFVWGILWYLCYWLYQRRIFFKI